MDVFEFVPRWFVAMVCVYTLMLVLDREAGQPIGIAAFLFLPVPLLPLLLIGPRSSNIIVFTARSVSFVSGIVLNGYLFFRRRERIWMQRRRDRQAEEYLERLRRGGRCPPFVLYLRPFNTNQKLPIPQLTLSANFTRPLLDLEMVLASSVRRVVGPLIGFGEWDFDVPLKVGDIGAMEGGGGRIYGSPDWRSDFSLLLEACSCVVICPSTRPGTQWEIDQIFMLGQITKCIWIMPETVSVGGFHWSGFAPAEVGAWRRLPLEKRWRKDRVRLARRGILLPRYDPRGMLFTVGENGRLRQAVRMDLANCFFRLTWLRLAIVYLRRDHPRAPGSVLGCPHSRASRITPLWRPRLLRWLFVPLWLSVWIVFFGAYRIILSDSRSAAISSHYYCYFLSSSPAAGPGGTCCPW